MKYIRKHKIDEGVFQPVDVKRNRETTIHRAQNIIGKEAVKYYLYSLLYKFFGKGFAHDKNIYRNYSLGVREGSLTGISGADFGCRIPNLYEELYDDTSNPSSEYIKRWNSKYNDFYEKGIGAEKVGWYGSTTPIKDVVYDDGKFIATVRLIPVEPFLELFPGEFINSFTYIENQISEKVGIQTEINFVFLIGEARYYKDCQTVNWTEECKFPGQQTNTITLYGFDTDTLRNDLKAFLKRFTGPKREYIGRLNIMDTDLRSFDDMPDFGLRFNFIAFDNITKSSISNYYTSSRFKFHVSELGDYYKFLNDEIPGVNNPEQHKPAIIIFPECMSIEDIEYLSDGVISKEECAYCFDNRRPVAFNPTYHTDQTPDREEYKKSYYYKEYLKRIEAESGL